MDRLKDVENSCTQKTNRCNHGRCCRAEHDGSQRLARRPWAAHCALVVLQLIAAKVKLALSVWWQALTTAGGPGWYSVATRRRVCAAEGYVKGNMAFERSKKVRYCGICQKEGPWYKFHESKRECTRLEDDPLSEPKEKYMNICSECELEKRKEEWSIMKQEEKDENPSYVTPEGVDRDLKRRNKGSAWTRTAWWHRSLTGVRVDSGASCNQRNFKIAGDLSGGKGRS